MDPAPKKATWKTADYLTLYAEVVKAQKTIREIHYRFRKTATYMRGFLQDILNKLDQQLVEVERRFREVERARAEAPKGGRRQYCCGELQDELDKFKEQVALFEEAFEGVQVLGGDNEGGAGDTPEDPAPGSAASGEATGSGRARSRSPLGPASP